MQVTGADGKPAPGAELSLGVVDEAIYAIRRDMTQDLLAFFFGREWNMVHTEDSLNYYFNGEAGKRRMRLAALRDPSRLAQLKPDRMVQPKVRKAFPDTAFWAADLVTDARGQGAGQGGVSRFADHLARHGARRSRADTRVGAAIAEDHRAQEPDPAAGRAALLRAGRRGHDLGAGAQLPGHARRRCASRSTSKGLDVLEGATREVRVPSRGEGAAGLAGARAAGAQRRRSPARRSPTKRADALELELPVNIPGREAGAGARRSAGRRQQPRPST